MGLDWRNNFSDKDIKHLLMEDGIKMIIPDKPNSRNQKVNSEV